MFNQKLTVKNIKKTLAANKKIKATGVQASHRGGTDNLFDVSVHYGNKTFSYVLGDHDDIAALEDSLIRVQTGIQEEKDRARR